MYVTLCVVTGSELSPTFDVSITEAESVDVLLSNATAAVYWRWRAVGPPSWIGHLLHSV